VLSQATGKKIDMTTGGLAGIGTSIPYNQRQPGDIIVWNGGTGGGHTGIINTVSGNGGTMWNNLCTLCGGVQISNYPTKTRWASAAVVRRL
jgi:cell wall-associated NlpC family hydrolase